MRFAICLTFCLFIAGALAQPTPNEQALQQLYNGFFEQKNLNDPTTIISSCYDDSSAGLTVNFIGTILSQLANYDIFDIESTVKNFQSQLPQSVKDCTNSNAEYQSVQSAYGIAGLTMDQITSKVGSYAFGHLSQLHDQASAANSAFTAGSYDEVGKQGGILAIAIFGGSESMKELSDAQNNLQLMANGLYEQVGLPDPTTVVACFDESSAELTVTFVGNIIQYGAANNINKAEAAAKTFQEQLPQSVQQCLENNAEVQKALQAYNLAGLTISQMEAKAAGYALLHYFQIHHDAVVANSDFQAGSYKAVGQEGGVIVQSIFAKSDSKKVGTAQDDLQQILNGFWEQGGLADPTTLGACFDETTANTTVTLIGNLLNDFVNSNIKAAEAAVENYANNLPDSVKTCVETNAEITQVEQAYNIYGLTVKQVESKVESYALFHIFQLHHDASVANSDFQSGNFKAVGQEGGSTVQSIFGKNSSAVIIPTAEPFKVYSAAAFPAQVDTAQGLIIPTSEPFKVYSAAAFPAQVGTAQDDLQQIADGFWEQAGLADPTTVVACFDEPTANTTITLIGNLLNDFVNSNIKAAEAAVESYLSNLPASVKSCLSTNAEITQVEQAYNVYGLTLKQVESKVEGYAVFHIFQLHHDASVANSDFQSGNFKGVGQVGGSTVQSIFGKNSSAVIIPTAESFKVYSAVAFPTGDALNTLGELFDGFWEQAGLGDPTTPITCFDEPNAQIAINFAAEVFNDLANNNFLDLPSAVTNFKDQISPSVMSCLSADSQVAQVGQVYGISGMSTTTLIAKVGKYALLHATLFHQSAVQINTDYTQAQYDPAGKDAGELLQAILSNDQAYYHH